MLMQSHEGVIDLLPALPTTWSTGKFDGVCARGAFELDMEWEDGQISSVEVLSKKGQTCSINPKTKVKVTCNGKRVRMKVMDDGTVVFDTEPGTTYMLVK